jgi:peptidyl-prolyl cis-trans isomerase D
MFDLVGKHKKLIQIILAIVFLPFAFFGIDSYFRAGDRSDNFATVGGQPITEQEFTQALQERQNYLQRMVGGRMDPALLDSSELRFAVLDGMVRQRLLISQAARGGLLVSDQQLQQIISEQPAFQEDGKFSHARYEELLRRQNMTPIGFENSLRRDLMVERVSNAYRATAIVPNAVAERLLRINAQQREVSQSVLAPENFVPQVKLEAGAAQQYYDAHQNEFQVAEQARLEYLVLALDAVASQVEVSDDEVKQFYEQNLKQYAQGDERQASHILIVADAKASAEEKQAARARAGQLLQQAKQNPENFAELARKNSQDPGSAANGGDLGFFPRGAMTKPFDDAVFQMKAGEIAGPVESEFGYHIIRLTAVKGGRGLDGVKSQVTLDLKRQKAGKKFSELAEQFNNLVFEQGDSLKPAADALKAAIQSSSWVSRSGSENKLLNNQKLLQAVFAEDAVKNKRNSEVVDVGNNTLIAARVLEYKPASVRPFAEVGAAIAKQLTLQQAAQLAASRGRELLAKLKQGETAAVAWSGAKLISREKSQGYAGPVLIGAFKADVGKLPAYAGIESAEGYVLLKITRVVDTEGGDVARRKAASEELRQMVGQEEFDAYVASLKLRTDIQVKKERLEKKER